MPRKKDRDATPGVKLLKMFRKLMLDGRKHFQADLADELQCSPQTIGRLAAEIEAVIGVSLENGIEQRKRYYQIRGINRSRLGLEFEELRYLSVCRDLAAPMLSETVAKRIDESIFSLSMLMADQGYAEREKVSAFVALVEKHPDVKTLPPEVAAAIDQGAAPLAAYESYLLAQKLGEKDAEIGKLQTELAALKADKNNRTTAPGSAKGMAEEPEDNNPLWRGWDSV